MRSKWRNLTDRQRRLLVAAGTFEGILKIAALADLWRRPSTQVNGSKAGWAAAITVINSAGVVPILYFRRGRSGS